MTKSPSSLLIKFSKLISNFFNPLNSLIIYFIIYSAKNSTLRESALQFLPILAFTIIPISGFIFWKVKKKDYTDLDVSNRQQRKSLYFFIAGCILVYLAFIYLRYQEIDWVLFLLFVLLVTMQVSNYFIKSSMHTALNIFVAALLFAIEPIFGGIWLGISVLVGISRIILKRHTLAEVLSGSMIAGVISFIYLYTHIQISN